MAAGHLYLVLAVLFLVGSVLGLDVDLREPKLQEHGGNIQTQSVNIEHRNKRCRGIGGSCVNVNRNCPSNKNASILPPGRPYCNTISRRCCYKPVEDTSKGCVFDGKVYPDKCYLKDTCMIMQCIDGTWKFIRINEDCGKCKVDGDPHVHPYDFFTYPEAGTQTNYLVNTTGEYVITQLGLSKPAVFGVNGDFAVCNYLPGWKNLTCINETTYYEPGIAVTLVIPPDPLTAASCTTGTPADDPACDIKVMVNNNNIGPVGNSVQTVYGGFAGPILVFKHKDIVSTNDLNCIVIVGTKGFSVALCEYNGKYPFFYIWAMPSLKSPPKSHPDQLYGLCGTWTGNIAQNVTLQNGTMMTYAKCLTDVNSYGEREICPAFYRSWETDNK